MQILWYVGMIHIPAWLWKEVTHRALCASPEECCGLIASHRGELTLYAAENASSEPRTSFVISPEDQLDIIMAMGRNRQELVGVYHSHPNSGPQPSERDRELAKLWPGKTFVIVGLHGSEDFSAARVFAGVLCAA
jgi:proteasome lid subunit RPN8/RPN11